MDTHQIYPGAIPDRVDPRDYKWSEIGSALPPFDWNKGYDAEIEVATVIGNQTFKLPVKDQNGSGSCGGQAWSSQGGVLEAIFSKSFEERSAKFIYAQTYVNVPGGGSAGRDNSNLVVKQGWGLESSVPSYDNGQPPREAFMERAIDITDTARQEARLSRALSYANVDTDIDTMAQAVANNHGVIIGITGSNNGTWNSNRPRPPHAGESLWYHWLYVGKAALLPDGKKALKVLNSWGTAAGDQGWQWIDEDYFNAPSPDANRSAVWSGWTHIFNTNPIPPAFHHTFLVDMKFGDKNDEVKALQTALQIDGEFPASVPVSGLFGTITANAVYQFQVKHGISPADRNHAGPKTRASLNQIFS